MSDMLPVKKVMKIAKRGYREETEINWHGFPVKIKYMLPKENADALPYAILDKCKDDNGKIRYENLDVVMRSAIVAAYTNMELPETRDELYILVNHTDIFSVILKNANTAQLNTVIRLVGYEPYFIRGELCQ